MLDFFRKFLLAVVLFSAGFFLPARSALAGEINFILNEANFSPDKFEVEAILVSEASINALEGDLVFLDDYASLEAVNDGNSVINFWIKRPQATAGNRLEFAGIIPGGFKGRQGSLFTMIFKSKNQLNPREKISNFIVAQKIRGFVNEDGQPSAAKLIFSPFDLIIQSGTAANARQAKPKDYAPPENFKPAIGRDPLMFEGKYFLVFGTQDKDSGVNYYEVKEGDRSFRRTESPYLLENQFLTEWVFVRAVDYAGNIREAAVVPLKYGFQYKTLQSAQFIGLIGLAIFAILSMLVILGYLLFNHTRKYDKD